MNGAQNGWSAQQKKFLDSLAAEPGTRKSKTNVTARKTATVADEDDDPEEIDISDLATTSGSQVNGRNDMLQRMAASSELHGATRSGSNTAQQPLTDAQDPFGIIRQMQAMQNSDGGPQGNPFAMLQQMQQSADAGGSGSAADFGGDPFAMMQQMMGAMGGNGPGMPMSGQVPGQMPMNAAATSVKSDATTRIWKLIHMSSMLLLLLLLDTASVPSSGSRYASGTVMRARGVPLFWYFITTELVLQSTRLFLYGPSPQPNFINQLAQFLPPPYAGYVLLLTRYSQILTTMKDDFFVLMFGLGISAWWNL